MQATESGTTSETILIVDDAPENLRLLSAMLLGKGYAVRAVTSGVRALASVHMETPNILLLDINLPDINGYEVCQRLKEDATTSTIPVIFISALDEVTDKVRGFAVGGVDYITKPFQVEEVLARIENQLTIQRTRAALERSEERFRLLAENAHDIIFRYRFTEPRGFEYISPSVLEIMGFRPEEYYADPDLDLKQLHPESLPEFGVMMYATESYREPIIMRYIRKDRQDVWIEQTHRIIRDRHERPVAIEGISRNVTERKRAEEQLKSAYQDLKVLNNRLQDELHMAQKIQHGLLPPSSPVWAELDVACYSMPAQEVGGDWYAYHRFNTYGTSPQVFGLALGDVSGKGMPAALLMAIAIGMFRSLVTPQYAPGDLLTSMDEALAGFTRTTRQNCSMIYLEFVLETIVPGEPPSAHIRIANAGCISPIIRRRDGTIEWVDIGGLPLGIGVELTERYREVTRTLVPGDMMIIISDGVVEARDDQNELFGFDRLEQALASGSSCSADALLTSLLNSLQSFVGDTESHDDVTIVVVQV